RLDRAGQRFLKEALIYSHDYTWLILFPDQVLHSGRSAPPAGRMAARARRRPAGVVSFPIKGLQQRPGGYAARPKGASLLAPDFVAPLAKDENHCLRGAPRQEPGERLWWRRPTRVEH